MGERAGALGLLLRWTGVLGVRGAGLSRRRRLILSIANKERQDGAVKE